MTKEKQITSSEQCMKTLKDINEDYSNFGALPWNPADTFLDVNVKLDAGSAIRRLPAHPPQLLL